MTKDELLTRLKGFEWNDVEFKLAQRGVPQNPYETRKGQSHIVDAKRLTGLNGPDTAALVQWLTVQALVEQA